MLVKDYFAVERRLGKNEMLVSLIRNAIGEFSSKQMAKIFRVSEANCSDTIRLIQAHPDWEDDQIAEEIAWEY